MEQNDIQFISINNKNVYKFMNFSLLLPFLSQVINSKLPSHKVQRESRWENLNNKTIKEASETLKLKT
ncbi:CLUMA_CG019260, isoform A [Clunio marinus]|uniref:CLUMA_CG019260, isoform A n=1 Tax=Clunio marinus TaxID=568069 RepID=A0A1J1J0B2_9DIPT|nr:CLUMA_CG019260, isoform A [Clunio marinus]